MAAPSGISWGSIYGSYCKMGIYVGLSNTDTTTKATVQVWLWTKYSLSDSNNRFYLCNSASSYSSVNSIPYEDCGVKSVSTSNNSGDGWSTDNQILIQSFSYSYTRGTSAVKRYLYALFEGIDKGSGNIYASTSFTIPALPTYTVSYDANGGTGAPSAQTKKYGVNLLLSTTIPTRTGHTFNNWLSTTQNQAYNPGTNYGHNANTTMKAQWTANTYTVSYNANGGSGAPAAQTKTYGTALTLSSTKPTRSGYNFLGWGTSASSTSVAYAAGASYTNNAAVTLYAIWQIAYIKPRITGLSVTRCNSSGTAAEDGTYALVKFSWSCDKAVSSIAIAWASTADSGSAAVSASGTSGNVSTVVGGGALSTDATYTIAATVTDGGGSSSQSSTLAGMAYTMDFLAGGKGVAFGKPAEKEGFDCAFTMYDKFNTLIGNGLAAYTGGGDSGIDPNTTLEDLCLTSHTNAPQGLGTFFYIRTTFYNTKSATAARSQVAHPYNKASSLYYRYYASGAWSSWERCLRASEWLDLIYPVNSIYIAYSHISPASLFGGTWHRMESRFLWGTPSTGTIGATGGENTHTLTTAEMPAHNHSGLFYQTTSGGKYFVTLNGGSSGYKLSYTSGSGSGSYELVTGSTGDGAAHNNMPPYVNVALWRRTA